MKKKLLKLFALIFCVGLFLTGCATVSGVKDDEGKNVYYQTPAYFQGQVAKVGDYLYFGNAYTDVLADSFKYGLQSKTTYLSRVNLSDITFDEDVLEENYKHTTPEGVEKVKGKKVVGYVNQEMYAYGDYLYFTSANEHKTNTMLNDYSRISLFRIKFNGDGLEELGTFTYSEESSLTLQKGSDGKYYFVIVCPTEVEGEEESTTFDVYSLKVGDSCGKADKIAEKVSSAFVADETSTQRNVIYSYGTESERLPNAVSAVDFATGDETIFDGGNSKEIKLVGREGDLVFYSYNGEIYYKDVTSVSTFTPAIGQLFYSAETISGMEKLGDGYVFIGSSEALMYKSNLTAKAIKLAEKDAFSDVLFVDGDYVYLSNSTSIMKVSKFGGNVETIVEGMSIISGECGYADGYIYFYAARGALVDENGETVSQETTDVTSYLYQTDKSGNIQLIGKTK